MINYKLCGFLLMFYYFWIQSQMFLVTDILPMDKIIDRLHDSEFVTWIVAYLKENNSVAIFYIALTTFLIDVTIIWVISTTIWTNNWRFITIYFVGIVLRQICQFINKLPIPDQMIWFDPGIWTVFMVYDVTGDFFFSGHTFTAISTGLELIAYNNLLAKIYGVFFICYQIMFVIVTRSHYFMDVYAAIATYFMIRYFYELVSPSGIAK